MQLNLTKIENCIERRCIGNKEGVAVIETFGKTFQELEKLKIEQAVLCEEWATLREELQETQTGTIRLHLDVCEDTRVLLEGGQQDWDANVVPHGGDIIFDVKAIQHTAEINHHFKVTMETVQFSKLSDSKN
ncbi:uncharacterized protein CIMG_12672 [Coccidioides immitis RS]|uniref:Uncharacterized protein n=1 Tax=Coccidioides immitis (strain RS) TaxID=246410 RepID=A0A0D8JS86_COCIM|nr:uncharacterized protein CIMG_12672 [Coccidioides immitis RS]KJF60004.1 hypothetical protein CIMG_12672 [Coccidioides immitis RS]TPX24855.1 hypothetical protein DIZ76_010299 [Coccidioides immitis]